MAIEIHLREVNLELAISESGTRRIRLTDEESGIAVCLAIQEEPAKKLASGLLGSGLIVPDGPRLLGGGNGHLQ